MINYKEIRVMLEKLGIKDVNHGVSTGAEWIDTKGDITTSFSPIDGKEIAKVKNATIDDEEVEYTNREIKIMYSESF